MMYVCVQRMILRQIINIKNTLELASCVLLLLDEATFDLLLVVV